MGKGKIDFIDHAWRFFDEDEIEGYADAMLNFNYDKSYPDDSYITISQFGKDIEKDSCEMLFLNKTAATKLTRFILSSGIVNLDDVLLGKPND